MGKGQGAPRAPGLIVALLCFLYYASAAIHTEFVTRNGSTLPEGHPSQTAPGAYGLPEGCITYGERYDKYANITAVKGPHWDPNADNPDATEVVLVRFRIGGKLPKDLLLHLRALVTEVTEAGKHIFLLHDDRPGSAAGDTPHKFRGALPEELRPVAFPFSPEAVHAMYPGSKRDQRDYLPFIMFLNRFPAYKFAWCIEHDVRYTGASWGELLDSAHALGSAAAAGEESSGQRRRLGESHTLRYHSSENWFGARGDDDAVDTEFKEVHVTTGKRTPKGQTSASAAPAVRDAGSGSGDDGAKSAEDSAAGGDSGESATLQSFAQEQKSWTPGAASLAEKAGSRKFKSEEEQKQHAEQQAYPTWKGWQPYRPEHEQGLIKESKEDGLTLDQLAERRKSEPKKARSNTSSLPDLLLLGSGLKAMGDEKPEGGENLNFSQPYRAELHVVGMSQQMFGALHDYSTSGPGLAQHYIPSLAVEKGLNVVNLPISLWGGNSHDCCSSTAKSYYLGWRESKECRQFALLHPIRVTRADTSLS